MCKDIFFYFLTSEYHIEYLSWVRTYQWPSFLDIHSGKYESFNIKLNATNSGLSNKYVIAIGSLVSMENMWVKNKFIYMFGVDRNNIIIGKVGSYAQLQFLIIFIVFFLSFYESWASIVSFIKWE